MNVLTAEAFENQWRKQLLEQDIIEGDHDANRRDRVLALLRSLLPLFVRDCAKENHTKPDVDCQLFPFGSYSLGGHIKGGDIDIVMLAPNSIRRRDFMDRFSRLLKANKAHVRDVEVIERANVPIIKCVIDCFDIDISFIRLQLMTVPQEIDLLSDSFVTGLDLTCLASTDGPRVSQFTLKHIYPNDLPVFQLALQTIKHWAKQRDLYCKPIGYLNGGSWSLLLLKTYFIKRAQLESRCDTNGVQYNNNNLSPGIRHENYSPFSGSSAPTSISGSSTSPSSSTSSTSTASSMFSTTSSISSPSSSSINARYSPSRTVSFKVLLESFFSMWSNWPWPTPVILTKSIPILSGQATIDNSSITTMPEFRNSLLPIISPCYPVTSSAPFVTKSTLRILTKELQRANRILHFSFDSTTSMMTKLFKPLDMIKKYKHFLKITVSCEKHKSHEIWSRRTPFNIPRLVQLIEDLPEIKLAHPLSKPYTEVVAYRTSCDKELLRNGSSVDETDYVMPLNPGTLFLNYFILGLEIEESCKKEDMVVDISEAIQTFGRDIDAKKGGRDSDVHVHVSAIKRRVAADIIRRYQT